MSFKLAFPNRSKRHGGDLIYETADNWGLIEVVDHRQVRSLHFGNEVTQSSLNTQAPHRLCLEYTKAMTLPLLLHEDIKRILVCGLGGGSLVNFYAHHCPDAQIDVLELRPNLIDIAQNYFSLPQDCRIQHFIGDAWDYFKPNKTENYDLILIDLYDAKGMADCMKRFGLMARIHEYLNQGGMAAFNLWSEPSSLMKTNQYYLHQVFGEDLAQVSMEETTNMIALVAKGNLFVQPLERLKAKAQSIDKEHQIGLTKLLRTLNQQNRHLF